MGAPVVDHRGDALLTELRYLSDLTGFRRALAQNAADAEASDPPPSAAPRQFVYVADANVLEMILDPRKNTDLTRVFSFQSSNKTLDFGTTVITAEFLLRGRLPGRGDYPLFVAPPHAKEFGNRSRDMLDEIISDYKRVSPDRVEALTRRVVSLRDRIRRARKNSDKLLQLFEKDLPRAVLSDEFNAIARPRVLQAMLRRNSFIRPLAFAPFIDAKLIDTPDEEALERWKLRVMAAATAEDRESKRENLLRDARTLAIIETLNASQMTQRASAQLVLITADETVLLAAENAEPDLKRCLVRRLKQYVPVINIRDMENSLANNRATRRVGMAIDAFLQNESSRGRRDTVIGGDDYAERTVHEIDIGVRSFIRTLSFLAPSDPEDPECLRRFDAVYRHLTKEAQARLERWLGQRLHDETERIAGLWRELIENAQRLNRPLITAYYTTWLRTVVDTLELANLAVVQKIAQHYEAKQEALAQSLAVAHVETVLTPELAGLGDAAEHWARTGQGLVLEDPRLDRIARGIVAAVRNHQSDRLQAAAERLCERRSKAGVIDRAAVQAGNLEVANIGLAAASVAMQLGRWSVAWDLAALTGKLCTEFATTPGSGAWKRLQARAELVSISAQRAFVLSNQLDQLGLEQRTALFEASRTAHDAANVFQAEGLIDEGALALAEEAACNAAALMLDVLKHDTGDGVRPGAVARRIADVAIAASRAIDWLDTAEAAGQAAKPDLRGRPIAASVRIRSGSALVIAALAGAHLGAPLPGLCLRALPDAARSLRAGRGKSRPDAGFTQLLADLARLQASHDRASPAGTEMTSHAARLDALAAGPVGGLPLERHFLRIYLDKRRERHGQLA